MTTSMPPEPEFVELGSRKDVTIIPHNREAEEATLGCVFINPDCMADIFDILQADDFYIHRHRWIYQVMVELFANGDAIDLLTVSAALEAKKQLDELGGAAYLTSLVNQVPSSLNAVAYAHIVEAYAIRRQMIDKANQIATLAYDETKSIEEVVKDYDALTEDRPAPSKTTGIDATTAADELLERIDAGVATGISTGQAVPDEEFGGFPKQAITIFLGEASTGKSAILLQAAEDLNFHKQRALYITLEEPAWRMVGRRVFTDAKIDRVKFRAGKLTDVEKAILRLKTKDYKASHSYLTFDQSARSVWQIRRVVHQRKPQLVIVDDLLHIHNERKGRGDNNAWDLIMTMTLLKDIAIDENCAIVVIHHLDKEDGEKLFGLSGKKPTQNNPPNIFNIPWASGLRYTVDMWLAMVPDFQAKLGQDQIEMVLWTMKDKESARLKSEIHLWYDKVAQWFYDRKSKHLMQSLPTPQVSAQIPTTAIQPIIAVPDEEVIEPTSEEVWYNR